MKKKCKVFVCDSYKELRKINANKYNLDIDPYDNLFCNCSTTYLLSLETVYAGEWCFELYEEYNSDRIRFKVSNKESAWLRQLNMDFIVKKDKGFKCINTGDIMTQEEYDKIDHIQQRLDFNNQFVKRLSKTSSPYFEFKNIDVIKVIASNNPYLSNSCLFLQNIPFNTGDVVEIEIKDNQIINLIKL